MSRKYIRYSKALLQPLIKESTSYYDVMRKLGLKLTGGSHANLKKRTLEFGLDTSHFNGHGWSKGKTAFSDSRIRIGKIPGRETLKKHLIKIRGHSCEFCNLQLWRNQPIVLEIDHIDGDNQNSEFDNLRLLCPNCHSQTPTWRGRGAWQSGKKVSDKKLLKALKNTTSIGAALKSVGLTPKGGNYKRCHELLNS